MPSKIMKRRSYRAVHSPDDDQEVIDPPDSPSKDKIVATLRELDSKDILHTTKLETLITDQTFEMNNLFDSLVNKIPDVGIYKNHRKMNLHEYLAMDADSTAVEGPSLQAGLKKIWDLEGESSPPSKIKQKESKYTDDGATSAKIKTTRSKKPTLSNVKISKKARRRSPRNISSSSMVTPSIDCDSIATALQLAGGFTPKFDPRFPITPAHGLRRPRAGEEIVLMSKRGSPLSHQTTKNRREPAIVLPMNDGKTITILPDTELNDFHLDNDTEKNLKLMQLNLASILGVQV